MGGRCLGPHKGGGQVTGWERSRAKLEGVVGDGTQARGSRMTLTCLAWSLSCDRWPAGSPEDHPASRQCVRCQAPGRRPTATQPGTQGAVDWGPVMAPLRWRGFPGRGAEAEQACGSKEAGR